MARPKIARAGRGECLWLVRRDDILPTRSQATPILIGADTICGVVGVKPRPKRTDRWIKADRIWRRGVGEKISALLAADVNGDGQGEVYVGTKNGIVHVLNVANGKTLGFCRLNSGRVNAFTPDPKRKRMLAATNDGTVLRLKLLTATDKKTNH